jgi:hypothetical protein
MRRSSRLLPSIAYIPGTKMHSGRGVPHRCLACCRLLVTTALTHAAPYATASELQDDSSHPTDMHGRRKKKNHGQQLPMPPFFLGRPGREMGSSLI